MGVSPTVGFALNSLNDGASEKFVSMFFWHPIKNKNVEIVRILSNLFITNSLIKLINTPT